MEKGRFIFPLPRWQTLPLISAFMNHCYSEFVKCSYDQVGDCGSPQQTQSTRMSRTYWVIVKHLQYREVQYPVLCITVSVIPSSLRLTVNPFWILRHMVYGDVPFVKQQIISTLYYRDTIHNGCVHKLFTKLWMKGRNASRLKVELNDNTLQSYFCLETYGINLNN